MNVIFICTTLWSSILDFSNGIDYAETFCALTVGQWIFRVRTIVCFFVDYRLWKKKREEKNLAVTRFVGRQVLSSLFAREARAGSYKVVYLYRAIKVRLGGWKLVTREVTRDKLNCMTSFLDVCLLLSKITF